MWTIRRDQPSQFMKILEENARNNKPSSTEYNAVHAIGMVDWRTKLKRRWQTNYGTNEGDERITELTSRQRTNYGVYRETNWFDLSRGLTWEIHRFCTNYSDVLKTSDIHTEFILQNVIFEVVCNFIAFFKIKKIIEISSGYIKLHLRKSLQRLNEFINHLTLVSWRKQ